MIRKAGISFLFLAATLSACRDSDATLELSGLNYTNVGISTFSVNGYHGGGIYPNGGGGSFVCCITMPRKWRHGFRVIVRWTSDERVPDLWKERIVAVPEYTDQDFGAFLVHFYPDDTVKVLVSTKVVGHPQYPYPRPK